MNLRQRQGVRTVVELGVTEFLVLLALAAVAVGMLAYESGMI